MRAPVLYLALVLCACESDGLLRWPDAGGALSAIVVSVTGGSPELEAFDGSPLALPLRRDEISDNHRLYVLYAARSLAVLGIPPGPVALAQASLQSRELPTFDAAFVLDVDAARSGEWRLLAALEEPLSSVRLPTSVGSCLLRGGCPTVDGCNLACRPTRPLPPEAPLSPDPPLPPMPPAAVRLTPCPPGWLEAPAVALSGVTRCDPRPSPVVCTGAEVEWLGTTGCSHLGPACPAGAERFAADLPASDVLFVDPTAAAGGDGSRNSPFRTIAEAQNAASPGDTLALAAADFNEHVALVAPDLTLFGACPERTRIVSNGADASAIRSQAAGARLVRLTIVSNTHGITSEGGALELEDVSIEATATALLQTGGDVRARHLVVRGAASLGLWSSAGTLELRESVIELADASTGIVMGADTHLIEDVRVTDLILDPSSTAGIVADGGEAQLRRVLVEGTTRGLLVARTSTVIGSDLVVRDTYAEGILGFGTVELERVHLLRSGLEGVAAIERGRVRVDDLLVEAVKVFEGNAPTCLGARAGARLTGERTGIACAAGVSLGVDRATMALADLTLAEQPTSLPPGVATVFLDGGALELDRAALTGSPKLSFWLESGSKLDATDLSVISTSAQFMHATNATVTLSRVAVEGGIFGAFIASGDVRASDYHVSGLSRGRIGDSALTVGIGTLDLERALFDGNAAGAILCEDTSRVWISDVEVRDEGVIELEPDRTPRSIRVSGAEDVVIARVRSTNVKGTALDLRDGASEIGDIRIDGVIDPNHQASGLAFGSRSVANGARIDIAGVDGDSLQITTQSSHATLKDVEIDAPGRGVVALAETTIDLERVRVTSHEAHGIFFSDGGTSGSFRDLHLVGPGACRAGGPTGAITQDTAEASIERFLVEGHTSYGLFTTIEGGLVLLDGEVRDSCVGIETFLSDEVTLERIRDVRVSDNVTPIRRVQQ